MTSLSVSVLGTSVAGENTRLLPEIERAAALGLGAVLVPASADLIAPDAAKRIAPLAARSRALGLRLLVDLEVDWLAIDDPLVAANPDAFAIRRLGASDAPVDPRQPAPPQGRARARLKTELGRSLIAPLAAERVRALIAAGVGGFRVIRPQAATPDFWRTLIDTVRGACADAVMIAQTVGVERDAALALGGCGFDYLVSSAGWWDGRARWLIEEHEALRTVAPLLGEVRPDLADPADAERQLLIAAATGSGIVVPAELSARPELDGAVRSACASAAALAGFGGEMRALTPAGAGMTALLRVPTGSVREADDAAIVLINTGVESAMIEPSAILPAAGVDLAGFTALDGGSDPFAPLDPGAVRVVTARRGRPVVVAAAAAGDAQAVSAARAPRLVIEDVSPTVTGGPYPVRRVVGDRVRVQADIFGDGHEQLAAELQWRAVDGDAWQGALMVAHSNDVWTGAFTVDRLGRHEFVIEAWLDLYGGFRRDFAKKLAAGVAQPVDALEGRLLIAQARDRSDGALAEALAALLAQLDAADEEEGAALLLSDDVADLMHRADARPFRLRSVPQIVDAERLQARYASWYELFPRSQTESADRHGTFDDVIARLPQIRDMGFDVLYFPPIHPIGTRNRKGPNNTLTPGPGDPGSPYAIGSAEGGHDALHPELGTFDDFRRLVQAAADHGLELALDFAVQCAPDHPWLTQHPGWFAWRPDGSMKYAENPPKKYQDIVNVDFYAADAVPDLWVALRDIVLLWVNEGVRTFRVDNPHTKPLPFWEWMIREVHARRPDVIFLAEAFTRPKVMYRLAKIGFSQSYTYFTWRDTKAELQDYLVELNTTAPKEFFRPHFFVNTPDINPYFLQTSGPAGFKIRAALAATLSGLFGVYSGFELCEWEPVPGKEEYLDSEKYEIRPRDWQRPGNIIADITLLNRLRKGHPALQTHLGVKFYDAFNDQVIYYGKATPEQEDMILVAVSLDPHNAQEADFEIPLWEWGLGDDGALDVEDLVRGDRFRWHGKRQRLRLTPDQPYALWRVQPVRSA
ncbi:MAG: alpha amylase catalytic region [Sphingomonas bacterium]|nr:alpha amylase catalytic region [Sphingomonas bacterium]